MTTHFHHPSDVLRFAYEAEEPCALVCVTDIRGGAMRAKGALMAVREGGDVAGYVSNGCVDADIIYQAKAAIKDGKTRRLKYGEGSPFKDIQLPCGGSIDLIVVPNVPKPLLGGVVTTLTQRRTVGFKLDDFDCDYNPKLRLRIAGKGAAARTLARQALEAGFEVHMQSPEANIADGISVSRYDHLANPRIPPYIKDDSFSAVILMFHDHDWEAMLLLQALASDAFYIGAMGSERTHALRVEALKDAGVSAGTIARIRGPIGLIPSMRDANLLALSTLAEIVKSAQESGRL